MTADSMVRWAMWIAALLLVAFLLSKARLFVSRSRPTNPGARRRFAEARDQARRSTEPALRAQAFTQAATIARDELGQPQLAASYALRAEASQPGTVDLALLTSTLRAARRFRPLERALWRRIARDGDLAAVDELIALYSGPMRRPHRAEALRKLRGGCARQSV